MPVGAVIVILRVMTAAAMRAVTAAGGFSRAFAADGIHDYQNDYRENSRANKY